MAGLTGRMSTVVKAKVSKLLIAPKTPPRRSTTATKKQVEQLQNVKKGIADVVTAKKRLQLQETTLQQQVVKLDTRPASRLVRQGRSRADGFGTQRRIGPRPSCSRSTPRSQNSKPSKRS